MTRPQIIERTPGSLLYPGIGHPALQLTAAETLLMKLLLRADGRPLRTREIYIAIYWSRPETKEEAVDHLIYQIRRKVRRAGLSPTWLRTVRGFGYVIPLDA
jgi:DNA-binding response OmpR family regulator